MLSLKDLTPTGVRLNGGEARLHWLVDGQTIETDFDRFRPVTIVGRGRDSAIVWRDIGDLPLTDPFFQGTLEKVGSLPIGAKPFKTDWEILSAVGNEPDPLPFGGVIFHMARTGSTLIHRLFSATGRVHSLSEVGMIERTLQITEDWAPVDRNTALRDVIGAFRRPRRPDEQIFITKMTDAGASIRLPQFRAAFPKVPWIFCYRDPVEVMVSELKRPTGNIDGWYKNRANTARRLGMPAVRDPAMWPAEFVARTLRRFCGAALESARNTPKGHFLAVHYTRLPDAIWETIGPHFGIEFSGKEIDIMRAEARFSSKKTDNTEFRPDSERKHEEATPQIKSMAERFVVPLIEELKQLPQA